MSVFFFWAVVLYHGLFGSFYVFAYLRLDLGHDENCREICIACGGRNVSKDWEAQDAKIHFS